MGLIATDVMISHKRKHSKDRPTNETDQHLEPDISQPKVHEKVKHHESDAFASAAHVHKDTKQQSDSLKSGTQVHEDAKQQKSNRSDADSKIHEKTKQQKSDAAASKPPVIPLKKVASHKHASKSDFSDKFNINDHPFPFKDDQL